MLHIIRFHFPIFRPVSDQAPDLEGENLIWDEEDDDEYDSSGYNPWAE